MAVKTHVTNKDIFHLSRIRKLIVHLKNMMITLWMLHGRQHIQQYSFPAMSVEMLVLWKCS